MKLLLHACCGPCSLEPVRLLQAAGHDIAIYYANSNIAPREEYAHRLATLEDWARSEGIPVIEGPYDPASWEEAAGRIGDAALADVRAARNRPQERTRPFVPTSSPSTPRAERHAAVRATGCDSRKRRGWPLNRALTASAPRFP